MASPRSGSKIDFSGVKVEHGRSVAATFSAACLSRSKLLQDLLSQCEATGDATLPVAASACLEWAQYVDHTSGAHTGRRPAAAGRAGSPAQLATTADTADAVDVNNVTPVDAVEIPTPGLCRLLLTADLLIDDTTKAEVAAEIGKQWKREASALTQTLHPQIADLPEPLQFTVLSSIPLPDCFSILPAPWHAPALRAHHPSIDTRAALCLPPLPPASLISTIDSIARLVHLESLTLAGATFPRAPVPPFAALSSLEALTALDLSDSVLSQAGVSALAAALPALHTLRSLNFSDNRISLSAMRALASALARCPALDTLSLTSTTPSSATNCGVLGALADAASRMQRLTALTIGYAGTEQKTTINDRTSNYLVALFRALRGLPALSELDVRCTFYLHGERAHEFSNALGGLTQLCRLALAVPIVTEAEPEIDIELWQEVEPDVDIVAVLGRGVAALLPLASLEVDLRNPCEYWAQTANLLASIARLTALTRLAVSHVSRSMFHRQAEATEIGAALQGTLDSLPLLCDFCLALSGDDKMLTQWMAEPALAVACTLPQLRALHAPLETNVRSTVKLLPALLAATQLHELSLDLIVSNRRRQALNLAAFMPLLPHVRTLKVLADDDDAWLAPLANATPQLTALNSCEYVAMDVPKMGCVRDAVEAAALLPSLRRLDIHLLYRAHEPEGDELLIQPTLLHRISRITALTALCCNVSYVGVTPDTMVRALPVPGLSRAVSALRRLRRFEVALYAPEAQANWRDMLAPLHLGTFLVHCARSEHAGLLLELLPQLQHLRCFQVRGAVSPRSIETLKHAVAELPGCHSFAI